MKMFSCHRSRPRRMLAWTLVGFLGIQLILNLFLEIRHPEIYDPEYRDRLVVLQQRLHDEPDRPLLLVTGKLANHYRLPAGNVAAAAVFRRRATIAH